MVTYGVYVCARVQSNSLSCIQNNRPFSIFHLLTHKISIRILLLPHAYCIPPMKITLTILHSMMAMTTTTITGPKMVGTAKHFPNNNNKTSNTTKMEVSTKIYHKQLHGNTAGHTSLLVICRIHHILCVSIPKI